MQTKPELGQSGELSAGLRRYLYFTAAICGAAVLIVEILGAKMLAPYFGTSHFVWTAQIAITLVSLAAGYYFGGRMVDRSPKLSRMYVCILAAAIYLCLTVPLCRPVSEACLKFKLAMGSMLASLFLFFVPLSLLATVGPFCIRLLTASVNSVGGQVGRLSALSTLGSVAGTILIGYVLIPFLPNSMTMFLTGAGLMALAVVYFGFWSKGRVAQAVVLAGALSGLGCGYWGVRGDSLLTISGLEELERRNSNFGLMQVMQATNQFRRYYLNDYLTQNIYDPGKKQSLALFTYALHGLAHVYTPKLERALCIGLGVGIVPMQFANEGVKVDVAEINPAVAGLAQRHFDLQPEKLNLTIGDGRQFLNDKEGLYDVVVLDAFLGDSSPSHLMTREAFDAMRQAMKPGGVLVINSFGDLDLGSDFFTASLERTLKAVFKSVKIHTGGTGNIFFVAADRPELKFAHQPDYSQVHPDVFPLVQSLYPGIVETDPAHGRVLTDDFNPVEYHDAANRERLRRYLVNFVTR